MAYVSNPYFNATYANAGQEIAKLLGGDPEAAAKQRYTNATTALTEAKQQRQQIENDALMTGLEEALGGMGMTPADYNKNLPALYGAMARAGIDPRQYQTGIFGARSMVNSPKEYTGGAMVTAAREPSWINPAAHSAGSGTGRTGGRGGRHGYAPIKITNKDRSAMEEMAANLLGAELGQDDPIDMGIIPPEALFRAQQAGENEYQGTRSQTDAAYAMIDALGLPDDAVYSKDGGKGFGSWGGRNSGNDWIPFNDTPAILDSSGAEVNFDFGMPEGAGAAPVMPAARASSSAPEATKNINGKNFVKIKGQWYEQ